MTRLERAEAQRMIEAAASLRAAHEPFGVLAVPAPVRHAEEPAGDLAIAL